MNSEPSEFEALRKLLTLKRHEQPPPGYFNRLPDQIAIRLERGEGRESFWEALLNGFAIRPALAYSVALAAFGALTLSVIDTVRPQPQDSAQTPPNSGWQAGAHRELASQFQVSAPLHVANWMGTVNASNPAPALPSLFDSGVRQAALPVSFASPP
jgi:hypothetical protein